MVQAFADPGSAFSRGLNAGSSQARQDLALVLQRRQQEQQSRLVSFQVYQGILKADPNLRKTWLKNPTVLKSLFANPDSDMAQLAISSLQSLDEAQAQKLSAAVEILQKQRPDLDPKRIIEAFGQDGFMNLMNTIVKKDIEEEPLEKQALKKRTLAQAEAEGKAVVKERTLEKIFGGGGGGAEGVPAGVPSGQPAPVAPSSVTGTTTPGRKAPPKPVSESKRLLDLSKKAARAGESALARSLASQARVARNIERDRTEMERVREAKSIQLDEQEKFRRKKPVGSKANSLVHPETFLPAKPSMTVGQAEDVGYVQVSAKDKEAIAGFSAIDAIVQSIEKFSSGLITARTGREALFEGIELSARANRFTRPLMETISKFWNGDPQIAKSDQTRIYETQKRAFVGNLARSLGGEKGVLTEGDIQRIVLLFPEFGETQAVRNAKMRVLKGVLESNINARKQVIRGTLDPDIAKQSNSRILDKAFMELRKGGAGFGPKGNDDPFAAPKRKPAGTGNFRILSIEETP